MFKRLSLILVFIFIMLLIGGGYSSIAEAASSFPTDVKSVTGKDELVSVADYGAKYMGVEWTNASGTKKKVIAYCRKALKDTPPKSGTSYTSYARGTKIDDYIVSNGYPTKKKVIKSADSKQPITLKRCSSLKARHGLSATRT